MFGGASDGTTPELTDEEKQQFLLTAEVIKRKSVSTGITEPTQLTMTNGKLTHDAHLQTIDVRKNRQETPRGVELNFRDCYKFNIAAYKLDRLIGLNMVPVSVERQVLGELGAVTWWVDNVRMMEKERYLKKISAPSPLRWNRQMFNARVFNELVYNTDANLGNLLITKDWTIWLVDFSRAFRTQPKIFNKKNLTRIDPEVLANLKKLDIATLNREFKPYLTDPEIKGLAARCAAIAQLFDEEIAKRGEDAVYLSLPER
jgi:hypothetical protein